MYSAKWAHFNYFLNITRDWECFEIFPIKRVSGEFIKLQNSFAKLSFAFMKAADRRECIIQIMDPINLIELSERHFNHIEQYKSFMVFSP